MPSAITYYPNGVEVAKGIAYSPVTSEDLPNQQLFPRAPDQPRQSDEQGWGRSPGQRWPHMRHTQTYNFDALFNQGWHPGERTRPERQGWSAPRYFEQDPSQHRGGPEPVAQRDTAGHVYTGLNFVGGM